MRSTVSAIRRIHRGRVRDVGGDQRRAPAEGLDLLDTALALLAGDEVVDDDIGPVLGEHACDAAADRAVARGAGDDRDTARQRRHGATLSAAMATRVA